jgi:hypothetical protein
MKIYSIAALTFLVLTYGGLEKAVAAEKIQKAKGGYTVEELYAKKDKLNGKKVSVRGKVVKFSPGIMGRNWIHLQDGTGKQGTNDMTVTTNQTAAVGDTALVTGTLVTNKDFGAGYKYAVIIEDATVKVEK